MFGAMSEQHDVMAGLSDAGVITGIRWAYLSAARQVLEDYSEPAGHDTTWVGLTRFTFFRDRLDRVFSCGRYALPVGGDVVNSPDVLHAALSEQDIRNMPELPPDLVSRADLNGSPGWARHGWRWLLASCAFGKIGQLPWPQKSPTKQRVARQPNPDPDQRSLFEGVADEEVGGLEALFAAAHQLDQETLVVAHTLAIDRGSRELVIGRPRLNAGGGDAWHWYQDLLFASGGSGGQTGDMPRPAGPQPMIPDAPVRLRRPADEESGQHARREQ
jgi:hypothetical protein